MVCNLNYWYKMEPTHITYTDNLYLLYIYRYYIYIWFEIHINIFIFWNVTFLSASCKPGANVIQAAIVPSINNNAYIIRVLVLLRHVGHWEQQKLQAVLPQRQASYITRCSNQYELYKSIYMCLFHLSYISFIWCITNSKDKLNILWKILLFYQLDLW